MTRLFYNYDKRTRSVTHDMVALTHSSGVPVDGKDPQRVARRRRIEQLLEEQQARKEDPLWQP